MIGCVDDAMIGCADDAMIGCVDDAIIGCADDAIDDDTNAIGRDSFETHADCDTLDNGAGSVRDAEAVRRGFATLCGTISDPTRTRFPATASEDNGRFASPARSGRLLSAPTGLVTLGSAKEERCSRGLGTLLSVWRVAFRCISCSRTVSETSLRCARISTTDRLPQPRPAKSSSVKPTSFSHPW